jgi:ACS family hexuronate transporter-like MFS transporter
MYVETAASPVRSSPSDPTMSKPSAWHWLPIGVFVLYTALNMLDRQLLAAVAPALREEFHLSNAQYGQLLSVFFSISMAASPLAGWFIDRVGLTLGASVSIAVWSIAGTMTGFVNSLRGLMACRFGLGLGEAGGGATPGAVLARYMDSAELGVGAALLAAGTSLGAIAAPLLAATVVPHYGWRAVFIVSGALGFVWIVLWLPIARAVPPRPAPRERADVSIRDLLGDSRYWGVVVAYALSRQTLWVSWTTLYFVQERGLTMAEANQRYSWYPSVFGAAGAFAVGALTMWWVRRGVPGLRARVRACWATAPLLLATAAVPFLPSAHVAAIAVGLSFFAGVCIWTSVHLMPIDMFGVRRSAFAYALLEGCYLATQVAVSPAIGAAVDRYGFTAVCVVMPLFPIAAVLALQAVVAGADPRSRAQ